MTFKENLTNWYRENKRDLPWRGTKDPYRIWLSEIILQQTRIEQGLPYYLRFIELYPTINDLAAAEEQAVLKMWQGLGYYSRARNLHATAKKIAGTHDSNFPQTYEALLRMKGIGEYTAAAIASISFGLPCPVVDGNVLRFFTRYFGISEPINSAAAKKKVYLFAKQHIDSVDPGTFNQAMMEFGALYCRPADPGCKKCIFRKQCFAYCNGLTDYLPVRPKANVRKERYFHYFLIRVKGNKSIYLRKRESDDIWKNLFDFPMIETEKDRSWNELVRKKEWREIFKKITVMPPGISEPFKHLLTHQVIIARFYEIEIQRPLLSGFILVKTRDLENYPFPRLIERYLSSISVRDD